MNLRPSIMLSFAGMPLNKPSRQSARSHRGLPWLLLLGAVVLGCTEAEHPSTPLARVDDQVLTMEDVRSRFDTARGPSEAQVYDYIQRWIVNELLYREAVRQGFDRSENLAVQLQDIRRQLTISAMLEKDVYQNEDLSSSPEEINRYFRAHRDEFNLNQDVALVSYVVFSDRNAANALRTMVIRKTPWNEARQQIARDPQRAMTIVTAVDSVFHTQATLVPANLWRAVTGTPVGTPSFPIRTEDGFYVLITWKLGKRGETADVLYVESEIKGRLAIERRQQRMNELLENLRRQHAVEILVGPADHDSTRLERNY